MVISIKESLLSEFGVAIKLGFEIEFYIDENFNAKSPEENDFLANILLGLKRMEIVTLSIDREVAKGQYEIALAVEEIEKALQNYKHLKSIIVRAAEKYGRKPIFEAKPFDDLPGSGMHVHISLHDAISDKNLYMRVGDSKESESEYMLYSIGGLCYTMLKNFTAFAPNNNSYKRYSAIHNFNNINKKEYPLSVYNNAPVNVSWGGNNRTTAIRIPASSIDETKRHIEHRVAGVDANVDVVVEKILEGIYIGLKDKILPPEKIFGNAYDAQYDFLERFPKSFDEAKKGCNKFLN